MKPAAIVFLLASGLSASTGDPAPELPEGVAVSSFTFVDESYLRGVIGSASTLPVGRNAAILNVAYKIDCIEDDAEARFASAQRILDETFVVAPLYAVNRREQTEWGVSASRALEDTGCVVNRVIYEARTIDPFETALWAARNRVPPLR